MPLPYSLALRLRDAGVADEVISEYVGVQEASLEGVYRLAEAKLAALRQPGTGDSATVNGNDPTATIANRADAGTTSQCTGTKTRW